MGLLANIEVVTAGSISSSTFADVPGLTTGSIAFGGVGKKLIFLANLIQATLDSIDAVAEFQYAVDGVREGPRVRTYKDAIDRADTLSGFMWSRPGMIGNHTITLQWRAVGGTPVLDTTRERNLQVIELDA